MVSRLRSWWQNIKQHPVATGVIGFVVVVVIALVFAVVWFNGTGFDGYTQVTTAHTLSGPNAGTVTRTEVYQPGKALWDWLQLLIIPAVLAVGVWWLNRVQQQRDQQLADQRTQTEQKAAEKRAQIERMAATSYAPVNPAVTKKIAQALNKPFRFNGLTYFTTSDNFTVHILPGHRP